MRRMLLAGLLVALCGGVANGEEPSDGRAAYRKAMAALKKQVAENRRRARAVRARAMRYRERNPSGIASSENFIVLSTKQPEIADDVLALAEGYRAELAPELEDGTHKLTIFVDTLYPDKQSTFIPSHSFGLSSHRASIHGEHLQDMEQEIRQAVIASLHWTIGPQDDAPRPAPDAPMAEPVDRPEEVAKIE